jgi:molybdopterin-guanine dinucleotide biosynthesis protein A
MTPRRLAAGVLCGGASRRFGSDKAIAPAGGLLLGQRVVQACRLAGIDPVVALGGSFGLQLGVPVIADRQPGLGPLAALAGALNWVGEGWMLIAPCDLPLLDATHLVPLFADLRPDRASVAFVAGRAEPSLAIWPANWARRAQQAVDGGARSFRQALELGAWDPVELPVTALEDADEPEVLARLLQRESNVRSPSA